MHVVKTELPDVFIIEPTVHKDNRGWFFESWSLLKMKAAGLDYDFIQDNHSYSAQKGVIRAIHFQQDPHAQAKLVRCTSGAVLDVAVDLRKHSPTYKKWVAVELSAENKRQLIIPRGYGHGFVTLTDNVEFQYKIDNSYNPDAERTIRYNDPDLAINWGAIDPAISENLLKPQDANAPFLKDCDCNFVYVE